MNGYLELEGKRALVTGGHQRCRRGKLSVYLSLSQSLPASVSRPPIEARSATLRSFFTGSIRAEAASTASRH